MIKYNYCNLEMHHKHDINSSVSNQQVISTGLKETTKQNLHRNTGHQWKISGSAND